eukprot:4778666-Prymnesium_polylepis.1
MRRSSACYTRPYYTRVSKTGSGDIANSRYNGVVRRPRLRGPKAQWPVPYSEDGRACAATRGRR